MFLEALEYIDGPATVICLLFAAVVWRRYVEAVKEHQKARREWDEQREKDHDALVGLVERNTEALVRLRVAIERQTGDFPTLD